MAHTHSHDHDVERVSIWRLLFRAVLGAIIVGLLVAYSMCFQVSEGYKAVVTQFGKPVRAVHEAGLFWKWPWPIEQAHQIDVRRRLHNTPYTATFTRDRRNVVLLSYVVWHVEDPLLYLQSVVNRKDAEEKLNGIVSHYKNEQLGRYELADLVSVNSEQIKTNAIEQAMLSAVAQEAREKFGIEVEQVGIKRIAYPEENMSAVLDQMRAERQAEAYRLRAEGDREARRIRDEALVKKEEILSKGRKEAGELRGKAEYAAAQIYREATQMDPEFYAFWRKLQAVKKILGEKATLIMRTDRGIFDVLRAPPEPPQASSETRRRPAADAPPASEPTSASVAVPEETP